MSARAEIAIGIVGAGSIARTRHLPNLRSLEGVRVVAVANRHVDRARAVAGEFDIPTVHEDWADVVTAKEVDAVFVCTPPSLHETVSLRALEAGKHVFCQARMAIDLESATRMLSADRTTGLTTMLCPPPHYMSVAPHVLRLIHQQKRLGELRHVLVHHPGGMFADPGKPLHWRQRADLSGINVLDIGIVAEVLHRWFGLITDVASTASTWTAQRAADADGRTAVETPDAISLAGRFASGVTLTALFSGVIPGAEASMVIHGTRGTLRCWPYLPTIELRDTDGVATSYDVPAGEQGSWSVEADFIEAVRRGGKGTPSFEDGWRYTALTQAVLDAADSGRRTAVPEVPAVAVR